MGQQNVFQQWAMLTKCFTSDSLPHQVIALRPFDCQFDTYSVQKLN